RAAENTGNSASARYFYSLQLAPFAAFSNEGVLVVGCHPHGPLVIEANGIGLFYFSESTTKVQAAVVSYIIFDEAIALHLGNDEPTIVSRDCNAIGKPKSVGQHTPSGITRMVPPPGPRAGGGGKAKPRSPT